MLALDTSVLVRFLVRDDQAQFEQAQKLIKRESRDGDAVLISLLVLPETEWVLRSRYGLPKSDILATFSGLLDSVELYFADEHAIEEALFTWKNSAAERESSEASGAHDGLIPRWRITLHVPAPGLQEQTKSPRHDQHLWRLLTSTRCRLDAIVDHAKRCEASASEVFSPH